MSFVCTNTVNFNLGEKQEYSRDSALLDFPLSLLCRSDVMNDMPIPAEVHSTRENNDTHGVLQGVFRRRADVQLKVFS